MNTDDLIVQLAQEARPVQPSAGIVRLAAGAALGAALSAALVVAWLGLRADLTAAVHHASYWMKWGYTLSLSAAALAVLVQLARPDLGRPRGLWVLGVPVVLLGAIGLVELVHAPPSERMEMWLGQSWTACPVLVVILAVPIFAGLLWSFRRLAPTRLRSAGAAAGLTAGAVSAAVYCLHCPEASALFVLTWYSLGIALATLLGALIGPRLLRW